jgi:rhodanese-related sulfurtransferase
VALGDEELVKARRISRDEAIKMVKARKAVYIDVRSKETYDESHIPGAINIPESQLLLRFKDLPPKKFLITYCA